MLNIGIEIPNDYVTQKGCILGVTGTGKSNGLGDILEEFCKNDLPFVVADVLGAHWGLAEKYKVAIFGGDKGEPLNENTPELYAEYAFQFDRMIFDMSHWNDFQMQVFMAKFLDTLFELHAKNRVPRHIFIEEAEVFFPQTGYDSSRESLLAGNRIMKRGRTYGLGMTLISQRPQDVNKKTLSQSQANFIMHMEGIQEIEVVNKLLKSETKENRAKYLKLVSQAKLGECLLYSPQWLGKTEFFKFRLRETFHAGYTPKMGETVVEPTDLQVLKPLGRQFNPASDQQDKGDATIEINIEEYKSGMRSGVVLAIVALLAIGLVMFQ